MSITDIKWTKDAESAANHDQNLFTGRGRAGGTTDYTLLVSDDGSIGMMVVMTQKAFNLSHR